MMPGISGIALLLAATAGSSVVNPVNISNETATKTKTDGTAATASFTFNTDRTVKDQDGANLDAQWITSGYTVGNYSIRVTVNSGTTPVGTLNTWLALSSARTWSLTDAAGAAGTKTCSLKVEIKENATGTILDTATYTLTADSSTGGATTYNPVAGTYNPADYDSVSFSVTASSSSVWTWSSSGAAPSSNIASGGSGTTITFTLTATLLDKACTITLQSGGKTWTINMDAWGSGGSGGDPRSQ